QPAGPVGPQPAGPVEPQAAGPVGAQPAGPVEPQAAGPVGAQPAGPVEPQAAGPVGAQPAGPVEPQAAGPVGPTAGPVGPTAGPLGPTVGLDAQAAATLFRVAQNTLANVREHAHAVNVQVTLRAGADRVELEVRDDGGGFEPGRVTGPSPAGRGLGLPAARARLRECGGDLAVGSTPGHGTCVRATVPLAPSARPAPVAAR
ncbi:ATP-binding protein, partial [Streptomyces sp. NPDC005811]|uniref:ATP-binding protein n=1 Tax=Streptomyces sp. NPDC005811 TaxID=3154565 RepID=UPI0033EF2F67